VKIKQSAGKATPALSRALNTASATVTSLCTLPHSTKRPHAAILLYITTVLVALLLCLHVVDTGQCALKTHTIVCRNSLDCQIKECCGTMADRFPPPAMKATKVGFFSAPTA
jgi:hypothetical protein